MADVDVVDLAAEVTATKKEDVEETVSIKEADSDTKMEEVPKTECKQSEPINSVPSKLEKDIIKQLEYYFGDANLTKDKFLNEQIGKDNGWVPLSVLLTFKRLSIMSDDPKIIVAAIEKSDEGLIEVHEDREKIRRHPERPLPEVNEERRKEIISRTAYVKGFPLVDIEMSDLIEFLHPFEKVVNINMRKYLDRATKKYLFKGSVFVTFSTKEECEEFLKKEKLQYKGTELITKSQTEYNEEKKGEKQERDKKRHKEKEPEFTLPKGTVILLEGITKETPREEMKVAFGALGAEVAYIEYNKGDPKAFVRLVEKNSAKDVFEKFDEGKININDEDLSGRVLEGDEEKEFLENVVKSMANRRNQSHRGRKFGGGRHGGGGNRKRRGGDDDGPPAKH